MRLWIVLLILSAIITAIGSANATTIYVNTTGWWINETQFNASATPIQSAIENASAGDTIIAVESGVYNGSIWIYKPLTIIAEKEGAVIDAYGKDVGVLITASNVTLKGFVIGNVSKVLGTGISVVNGWNVQLIDNKIVLDLINGTGIATTNASNIAIENNIVNITANDWATGLSVIESPNAQIKDNNVNVYVEASDKVTVGSLDVADQYYLNERSLNVNFADATGYMTKGTGIYAEKSDGMGISGNYLNVTVINLNTANLNSNNYLANSRGIVIKSCEGVSVNDNSLNVMANATTIANVNGIYVIASPDCSVNGNGINANVTAYKFAQYHAIGVYKSVNAKISGNEIVAAGRAIKGYYNVHNSYGMGIDVYGCDNPTIENNRVDVKSVAENRGFAIGMCVDSANDAAVKGNVVTSTNIVGYADGGFGVGLFNLKGSTVSDNSINITIDNSINITIESGDVRDWDYQGMLISNCRESTIDSNDIIIESENSWSNFLYGIYTLDSEKLWITNNAITINQTNGEIWAEGIYIEGTPYSHVNGNKITLSGSGYDYADSVGIDAWNCHRIEIKDNAISIDNRGLSPKVLSPEEVVMVNESLKLPERVEEFMKSKNVSVKAWWGAEGYGVWVESCDFAKVEGNTIKINAVDYGVAWKEGGETTWNGSTTHCEGIDIRESIAPEVTNNIIEINCSSNAGANAEWWARTHSWSGACGIWIDGCPPSEEPTYHVPTVKGNVIKLTVIAENSTAYANATWPEWWIAKEKNVSKIVSSLYEALNVTAYKIKDLIIIRPPFDLPVAHSFGEAYAEGILVDYSPDALITENDITIHRKVSAIANATLLLKIEASSGAYTFAGSCGIDVWSPDVEVSRNVINVNGITQVTAIATEKIEIESLSEVRQKSWDLGIGGVVNTKIENNTVNVSSVSKLIAKSSSEINTAWAVMEGYSNAIGIESYDGSEISGNVINVNGNCSMDLGASGTATLPSAYGEGYVTAVGIDAFESDVTNNKVNVHASNDGAIMSTRLEEVSALTTVSAGNTAGVGVGIFAPESKIDNNEVNAFGSVNMTVIASEKNEESYSIAMGLGAGVGVIAWNSEITRNVVTGNGYSDVKAISEGYYPENVSFGFNLSIGVIIAPVEPWWWYDGLSAEKAERSVIMFNDLINSRDCGLVTWNSNDDARYNYWGDASGPSGLGPGVGDAIYSIHGTVNYQPWLTRSFKVVLGERKAYFGFELCRLREGWNTLSIPIALENNTWAAITKLGDGLNYIIAYTWDPVHQRWVQVLDTTKLNPMDAVYIKMASDDRVPLCISPRVTNPPVKELKRGWNLIGPAFRPVTDSQGYWNGSWEILPVNQTLISAESTSGGLRGYTIVISPPINEHSWVYTANQKNSPYMDIGRGYWIYMENDDTLAGFSATPLKIPYFK